MERSVRGDSWLKDSSKSEGKVYKMGVRPALMYGLETVPLFRGHC